MAIILCIETSTSACSVALVKDGVVTQNEVNYNERSHATALSPLIQKVLDSTDSKGELIDAVAISCGPGSYTGLRIGVSTAKGLCYGKNIPLISVNTLELIAHTAQLQVDDKATLICPMIDARRMEVYTALYSSQLEMVNPISAEIIDATFLEQELRQQKIVFAGDGAAKCKEMLTHVQAHFLDGIIPLATHMAQLATDKYRAANFEDVAYFEPFYLKEFVATTPKKKVL